MSYRSKRELLAQVAPRYQQASHVQKSVILDEFVAATGYARKYAIRLLTRPPLPAPTQIRRPRAPLYGTAVQSALEFLPAAIHAETLVAIRRTRTAASVPGPNVRFPEVIATDPPSARGV